jgi:hypothetical protein
LLLDPITRPTNKNKIIEIEIVWIFIDFRARLLLLLMVIVSCDYFPNEKIEKQ